MVTFSKLTFLGAVVSDEVHGQGKVLGCGLRTFHFRDILVIMYVNSSGHPQLAYEGIEAQRWP